METASGPSIVPISDAAALVLKASSLLLKAEAVVDESTDGNVCLTEFRALCFLRDREGSYPDIATELGCEHKYMFEMLLRLEATNMVEVCDQVVNMSVYTLTDEGRGLIERISAALSKEFVQPGQERALTFTYVRNALADLTQVLKSLNSG